MPAATVRLALDHWFPVMTFRSVPWRNLPPCGACTTNPDHAEDSAAIVTYRYGNRVVRMVLGAHCFDGRLRELMENPEVSEVAVDVLRRADLMEDNA